MACVKVTSCVLSLSPSGSALARRKSDRLHTTANRSASTPKNTLVLCVTALYHIKQNSTGCRRNPPRVARCTFHFSCTRETPIGDRARRKSFSASGSAGRKWPRAICSAAWGVACPSPLHATSDISGIRKQPMIAKKRYVKSILVKDF